MKGLRRALCGALALVVATLPVGAQNLGPSYPLGAHFGFWFLSSLPSWVTSNASYANGASMVTNWQQANTDGTTGQGYLRSCNCTANANTLWTRPAAVAGAEGTAFDAAGAVVDYTGQTNRLKNSTMQGAVAGTPPTGWTVSGLNGLSQQILGTAIVNGQTYLRIRLFGTTTAASNANIQFETTDIAAAVGQTWTISAFAALEAGSFSGVNSTVISINEANSGGGFLSNGSTAISPTTNPARFSFTRTLASSTTAFVYSTISLFYSNGAAIDVTLLIGLPQLQQSAAASPPIPTYGAAASAMRVTSAGLTTEEARTNLVTQSNFASAWTTSATSLTPNSTTSPDGTTNAAFLAEDGTTAAHFIRPTANATITAGSTYAYSVFVKANQDSLVQVYIDDGTSNGAYLIANVSTGVITQTTARGTGTLVGATISAVSRGFYRLTLIGTAGTTSTAMRYGVILTNASTGVFAPSYAGTLGNGVYVWGTQLELGSFATTLQPTSGTTVTRAQDGIAAVGSPPGWLSQAPFSMMVVTTPEGFVSGVNNFVSEFDDGSINNRASIIVNTTTALQGLVTTSSTTQTVPAPGGTILVNTMHKSALALATNDAGFSADGTPQTRTTGMTPPSITTGRLGIRADGVLPFSGTIQQNAFFPTSLTNTALQAVTQ